MNPIASFATIDLGADRQRPPSISDRVEADGCQPLAGIQPRSGDFTNYSAACYTYSKLGDRVRIFVVKGFARFQRRERLGNEALCEAVDRAERGLIDADLGAGLIKQRVGRPGQGRRGGFRTLLAYRAGSRVVFLLGFAKNERDNIDADELEVLRARAQ
ncbi:MAG: type II toxin-antitoxin system RelE/ParE family toxin, partial [Hyphomicrobium sp.]